MNENQIRVQCAEIVGIKPPFKIIREGSWIAKKELWTIPDYPTDPAAALSLVDWMKDKGWKARLTVRLSTQSQHMEM